MHTRSNKYSKKNDGNLRNKDTKGLWFQSRTCCVILQWRNCHSCSHDDKKLDDAKHHGNNRQTIRTQIPPGKKTAGSPHCRTGTKIAGVHKANIRRYTKIYWHTQHENIKIWKFLCKACYNMISFTLTPTEWSPHGNTSPAAGKIHRHPFFWVDLGW